MSNTARIIRVESPVAEVGIGRSLTTVAIDEVADVFNKHLPKGVNFEPWDAPGVIYVSPAEISASGLFGHSRSSIGSQKAKVDELLVDCTSEEMLDEDSVSQPISINMDLDSRQLGANTRLVLASLMDVESAKYPNGRLLKGEALAIRQALGIRSRRQLVVRLGILESAYSGLYNHQVQAKLHRSLSRKPADLSAVEPIAMKTSR